MGAIDGTYVPIKAPEKDAEIYITRKCNYAMTLQAISDTELNFTDCYIGFPGSVGDARIFRMSHIYQDIMNNPNNFFPGNEFIIGDKAYPLKTWCITPYIERRRLNNTEKKFNLAHAKTRQCIERTFALLFGRFRRLKYLDMTRTDLIPATVIACCVLHNICLNYIDLLVDDYIAEGNNFVQNNVYNDIEDNAANVANNDIGAEAKRSRIARNIPFLR